MQSPERQRIDDYANELELDAEKLHGLADSTSAAVVAQAIVEAKEIWRDIVNPAAWIAWRARRAYADQLRAGEKEASRSRLIDQAADARRAAADEAAEAARQDEAFFESLPASVVANLAAEALAKMDDRMRKRLETRDIRQSAVLRGIVIAKARVAGYKPSQAGQALPAGVPPLSGNPDRP